MVQAMIRPPPFFLVPPFLFFRHPPELISGIAQHAIQNAASGVLPIDIPLIGQAEHLLRQVNRLLDISIAGFHVANLSGGAWLGQHLIAQLTYQNLCQTTLTRPQQVAEARPSGPDKDYAGKR
jgi:hypothetical protein